MSKLQYITNIRLPTEKAHGLQVVKTCEALAGRGVDVTLVIPRRINPIKVDVFSYYGSKKIFALKRLPSIDLIGWFGPGKVWFALQSMTFALFACFYAFSKRSEIILTRNVSLAALFSIFSKNVFLELHWLPENQDWLYKIILKRLAGTIVISQGIFRNLESRGLSGERTAVVPDAVDVEMFTKVPDKSAARKELGLPLGEKIVLYTGHFYSWKGASLLAEAAPEIGDLASVYIVGGTDKERREFEKKYHCSNLIFPGWKPNAEIPLWLSAADILVLPTSAKKEIGRLYTSPLKLYEYIASGKTIIASDVPSNRDVLGSDMAKYFIADDKDDLIRVLRSALSAPILTTIRSDLSIYSWHTRAESISSFIFSKKSAPGPYVGLGGKIGGGVD